MRGDIVGFYVMHRDVHGFTLDKGRFLTHDDNAGFSTIISGVNKFDTIVGFLYRYHWSARPCLQGQLQGGVLIWDG